MKKTAMLISAAIIMLCPGASSADDMPCVELRWVLSEDELSGREYNVFKCEDEALFVENKAQFTERDMTGIDARWSEAKRGSIEVEFYFNESGKRRLSEFTKNSTGRRFAIFIDKEITAAPRIIEPITTGEMCIAGDFADQPVLVKLADRCGVGLDDRKTPYDAAQRKINQALRRNIGHAIGKVEKHIDDQQKSFREDLENKGEMEVEFTY